MFEHADENGRKRCTGGGYGLDALREMMSNEESGVAQDLPYDEHTVLELRAGFLANYRMLLPKRTC